MGHEWMTATRWETFTLGLNAPISLDFKDYKHEVEYHSFPWCRWRTQGQEKQPILRFRSVAKQPSTPLHQGAEHLLLCSSRNSTNSQPISISIILSLTSIFYTFHRHSFHCLPTENTPLFPPTYPCENYTVDVKILIPFPFAIIYSYCYYFHLKFFTAGKKARSPFCWTWLAFRQLFQQHWRKQLQAF